jgi:superfamily II DNA or RNA helicase
MLTTSQKIALFTSLFRGRIDAYCTFWENKRSGKSGFALACHNEWVSGVCNKPKIKCSDCKNQAYPKYNEEVATQHLSGLKTIAIYPLLLNETCWFSAMELNKNDTIFALEAAKNLDISVSIEALGYSTQSEEGSTIIPEENYRLYLFFEFPILASVARKLATLILTKSIEKNYLFDFSNFDRIIPATMQSGYGRSMPLPLQKKKREMNETIFVDSSFQPYPDQWQYLVSIKKLPASIAMSLVAKGEQEGTLLPVRTIVQNTIEKPWELSPSKKMSYDAPITSPLPETITLVLANQIYIEKKTVPAELLSRLIRLAAFENPEYHLAEKMRMSTFGKPRIITCCEHFPKYLGIPRGMLESVKKLLLNLGVQPIIDDKRIDGKLLETNFIGKLHDEQELAAKTLLKTQNGVLAATTAFGKTVLASYMIAKRKTNVLILVHRSQLMDQWVERLRAFLDIDPKLIGTIGGGKRKATGLIDVALIQSLVKKDKVDDCLAEYGHLIVDECHHLSAFSFEKAARAFKGKYTLGLSATVERKDGHHPIIFMQCGAVRYKVDAKKQAKLRAFTHQVILRSLDLEFENKTDEPPHISKYYEAITSSKTRNQKIYEDVKKTLELGRSPIVITERKDHIETLTTMMQDLCKNVVVLVGGQTPKRRKELADILANIPDSEPRLIIATGRYIGEGFDDARLDTMFLAMPISWQGTIAQYAGRLHRNHHAKKQVIIYDYVDSNIAMLGKMAEKRVKGYQNVGYEIVGG